MGRCPSVRAVAQETKCRFEPACACEDISTPGSHSTVETRTATTTVTATEVKPEVSGTAKCSETIWQDRLVIKTWDPAQSGYDPAEYLTLAMPMLVKQSPTLVDGWAWGETSDDPPRSGWFPP